MYSRKVTVRYIEWFSTVTSFTVYAVFLIWFVFVWVCAC